MRNQTVSYLFLIPLFPLLGAAFCGSIGYKLPRTIVGSLASLAVFSSFVVSLVGLIQLNGGGQALENVVYVWNVVGGVRIDVAFLFDNLSAVMALVVTGVSTLIHVYSIGYMGHDRSSWRFFAYLNLFVFAMTLLILGNNLVMMFVGWEGVGLCSYLLIGFWYDGRMREPDGKIGMENPTAGMKAFIVNRIGDFGFILGIFLIVCFFLPFAVEGRVLDFLVLRDIVAGGLPTGVSIGVVTLICLLLFVGAAGKSAQIPLYIWLPDAMAGPTPVSALIHAATMVTAGVYMVARMSFLYIHSPIAQLTVAGIGALTALFAATIGIAQRDIKKVLAYSTVSQLGYMFIGVGICAYSAGVFHLVTHAFFKALLFLGAGSVIHGMDQEQDIYKMGGLKKYMPITYWTFLIATIAIAGIPPFAGFFSKDEILWMAFNYHNEVFPLAGRIFWFVGLSGALITAFYMFRLVSLTFWGGERFHDSLAGKTPHESPPTMTYPLIVLAFLSFGAGWLGMPQVFGPNIFHHFLEPSVAGKAVDGGGHGSASLEWMMMILSVVVAAIGIFAGTKLYADGATLPTRIKTGYQGMYRLLYNKYYIDELYALLIVRPLMSISRGFLWKFFDTMIIDGAINGIAMMVRSFGQSVRKFQSGVVHTYAYCVVIGAIAFVFYLVMTISRGL